MNSEQAIFDNIQTVRARIALACDRIGRIPETITLIAVSKGVSLEAIAQASRNGLADFGENRVQEAGLKIKEASFAAKWHFIGPIQTNKAAKVMELGFTLVHSVGSIKLAVLLNKAAQVCRKRQDILLEVNIGDESQKHGFRPGECRQALQEAGQFENLKIRGLMCMGPAVADPQEMRPYFRMARRLWEDFGSMTNQEQILSMGMSQDFEVAIEEGATMIRVGRALFSTDLKQQRRSAG